MPTEVRRREPAPDVFRLVLPLSFPGLDRVNAYLLAGDRCTLIDCGIYFPSDEAGHGWDHLAEALSACDVTPADIERLVVTHPHIDHYGMAGRLLEETGCELWMHEVASLDLEIYRDPSAAAHEMEHLLADHGVTPDRIDDLTAFENWRPFVHSVVDATNWVSGGETFEAAGRTWEIVHTPGHARSHVCVWSGPDEGLLASGDHLLPTITPHIDFRRGEDDPLGEFLSSLDHIEALAPRIVLPGHGRPFEDGADRARVIARHHDRRLGAILQVIRHEPRTVDEITDEIWGTTLLHFERRLALGEALAHIAYLRQRGEIERRERDDGTFEYVKVSRRRVAEVEE